MHVVPKESTLADVSCRGSVRLYSDFYESDIIVASPLALATKLSEDEEEGEQQWHLQYACPGLAFRRCITDLQAPAVSDSDRLSLSNSVGPHLLKYWLSDVCLYSGLGVCSLATCCSLLCRQLYKTSLWQIDSCACLVRSCELGVVGFTKHGDP